MQRISVTPCDNERQGFEELPENEFDRSDRKFLVVALITDAVHLNATGSDYIEHKALIDDLGVKVEPFCPQHAIKRA